MKDTESKLSSSSGTKHQSFSSCNVAKSSWPMSFLTRFHNLQKNLLVYFNFERFHTSINTPKRVDHSLLSCPHSDRIPLKHNREGTSKLSPVEGLVVYSMYVSISSISASLFQ